MSTKDFMKPQTSYKPDGDDYIEYLKAEKIWDQRDGTARQAAYNLRLLLIIALIAIMILSGGIIYQSSKSTVVPYVVQVGSDGQAQAVTLAKEAVYEPKEAEIKYFLERFVQESRTLPLDPVVAKKQWTNAFSFLRTTARTRMTDEFRKDNMQGRLGTETSQITVKTILQQSQDTYQARWTEEVYNHSGNLIERYNMSGTFTIELSVPTNEKEVRINPLGLYIKNFSWAREL